LAKKKGKVPESYIAKQRILWGTRAHVRRTEEGKDQRLIRFQGSIPSLSQAGKKGGGGGRERGLGERRSLEKGGFLHVFGKRGSGGRPGVFDEKKKKGDIVNGICLTGEHQN